MSVFKSSFGAQLNLDHSLAKGLVGCWLMNEDSGIYTHDYSGQGNTGTLIGMNDPPIATSGWNAGPHGGALAFDGSNNYVDCETNLKVSSAITVIANIIPLNLVGTHVIAASIGVGFINGWEMESNSTALRVTLRGPALDKSAGSMIAGTNYQAAFTYETTLFLYLNGAQIGDIAGPATIASLGKLTIGERAQATPLYFNGRISCVMVYNRALSTEEIAYLYSFPYCMFDEPVFQIKYLTIEVLGASGQVENVKRSLEKYMQDNIYSTEGISIDFLGLPFNNKNSIEWIVPRFLINRTYISRASGTEYGYDNNIVLGITINIKKSNLTITDRHYIIRDSIIKYFKIGEDIDLNNWIGDGSFICNMRVREVIEDSSLGETNNLLSYKVVLGINYTEKSRLDY